MRDSFYQRTGFRVPCSVVDYETEGGREPQRFERVSTLSRLRSLVCLSLLGFSLSLSTTGVRAEILDEPARVPAPSTPMSVSAAMGDTEPGLFSNFHYLSRRLFRLQNMSGVSIFDAIGSADAVRKNQRIAELCDRIDARYRSLGWGRSPCSQLPWTFERVSERGNPLIFWEYSGLTPNSLELPPDESTLVFGGVHPDELTPINLAFRFAEALNKDSGLFAQHRVVVAPIVNPDGFFTFPARRTNANGVDLNRNFGTRDWWSSAWTWWKKRRNSDPRHFPGVAPETEEGTRFQVDLINRFEPDKVVSIHAPLGFLDYDGPGDNKRQNLSSFEKKARDLAYVVSRNSNNYRVLDFVFYPGSLGNFAGNERQVPTVTLELSSTNPRFADKYWREFFPGLRAAVKYEFKRSVLARMDSMSLQSTGSKPCCDDYRLPARVVLVLLSSSKCSSNCLPEPHQCRFPLNSNRWTKTPLHDVDW